VEKAFAGWGIDGGHPEMNAVGLDALNVMSDGLEFENSGGGGRAQCLGRCSYRKRQEQKKSHGDRHSTIGGAA
jgi:hypothetical protein